MFYESMIQRFSGSTFQRLKGHLFLSWSDLLELIARMAAVNLSGRYSVKPQFLFFGDQGSTASCLAVHGPNALPMNLVGTARQRDVPTKARCMGTVAGRQRWGKLKRQLGRGLKS